MTRAFVVATLALLGILTGWLLLRDRSPYELHLRFANAGQIVTGGDVQIAGRRVGSIKGITLAADGDADVRVRIQGGEAPLRADTRAAIRAVGQAGIANRFVDLRPGVAGPVLASGSTLPRTQTQGIVDLDEVLDTLTPPTRRDVRAVLAAGADVFAGSSAARWNSLLGRLDPAFREVHGVSEEVAGDREALRRLLSGGAQAATALASRDRDLRASVGDLAATFKALADERGALGAAIRRAPRLLDVAGRTLADVAATGRELRPALRAVPPAATPLGQVVDRLPTTLPHLANVSARLRGQLPGLTSALDRMPRFAPATRRALTATGTALRAAQPIARGLRIYGVDFILGIFNGLAGLATGNYNALGQYVRIEFAQNPQTFAVGQASSLLGPRPLAPSLFATRYGLTKKCPGGGAPPAPDGSSPFIPDRSLCDPGDDMPASVNEP